jgi:hypothetical protein
MKKKIEHVEKPRLSNAGYQVNLKDLNGEPFPDLGKLHFRSFKNGGARMGTGRKPVKSV